MSKILAKGHNGQYLKVQVEKDKIVNSVVSFIQNKRRKCEGEKEILQ